MLGKIVLNFYSKVFLFRNNPAINNDQLQKESDKILSKESIIQIFSPIISCIKNKTRHDNSEYLEIYLP